VSDKEALANENIIKLFKSKENENDKKKIG
jgi:hypothetical protein